MDPPAGRGCRFRTGGAGASGRCRADSPVAGRAGTNRGLCAPGPPLTGPTRTPGLPSAGPTRPRTPGYFLLVQKVPKNTPKPRFWNPLSNQSLSDCDGALPLNQRILRGSDLWRVSRPASTVSLLKRQIHLFVSLDTKCLSSRGPTGEVRRPPHRLRGTRGPAEIQWLRSALLRMSD